MPNVISYAEKFERELQQKYAREMTSYELTLSNSGIKFANAKKLRVPTMALSGYKNHNRNAMSFNTGDVELSWEDYELKFDRDVEFAIDPMDIDEANLTTEIANIQNTFEDTQAIPEKDSYRYSKLYAEAADNTSAGAKVDTTSITENNILDILDDYNEEMDDEGVPSEGRLLYLTSAMYKLLKNAKGVERHIDVRSAGAVNRNITQIDDLRIIKVPSARMKTAYNFSVGAVPAETAKQINMILVHPSCMISRDKYAYIKVFLPGTDSRTADKYVYQNRYYSDTFLIPQKAKGVAVNVNA